MDLQDGGSLAEVRQRDLHLSVEPARPKQGRVEDLRPVRRRHDHHAGGLVEPVHLRQQLIEGLFTLVVRDDPCPAPLPDRIDLVDEDDRRRPLSSVGEEVADP